MAALIPQIAPWVIPVRGSKDGVNDRHEKITAPQQPGRVTYNSFRCFSGFGDGEGTSASGATAPSTAAGAAVATEPASTVWVSWAASMSSSTAGAAVAIEPALSSKPG